MLFRAISSTLGAALARRPIELVATAGRACLAMVAGIACIACGAARAEERSSIGPPYAAVHPLARPALLLPGLVSTGDDESTPTFTGDGTSLYFLKNNPSFTHWTVLVTSFRGGRWSTPEVAPFSGQYGDGDVVFTARGDRMFFVSNRPVKGAPRADTEIWTIARTGEGWGAPEHVPALSSEGDEYFPTLAASGAIYFASDRRGGLGQTDIWRSRWVNGLFEEPENVGAPINSSANEIEAFVAPDESYMILAASGRAGNVGSYDLYLSERRDGAWSEPKNLGPAINSKGWDFSPRVSPDGRYLFFASNRGFTDAPQPRPLSYRELVDRLHGPGNGLRDIYQIDLMRIFDEGRR